MFIKQYILDIENSNEKMSSDWMSPKGSITCFTPYFVRFQIANNPLVYDTTDLNKFKSGLAKFNLSEMSLELQLYFNLVRYSLSGNDKNEMLLNAIIERITSVNYRTGDAEIDKYIIEVINEITRRKNNE